MAQSWEHKYSKIGILGFDMRCSVVLLSNGISENHALITRRAKKRKEKEKGDT